MSKTIEELVAKQRNLKQELLITQKELARQIQDYEGSLMEALASGIVRLNFPAPRGFYNYLKGKYSSVTPIY